MQVKFKSKYPFFWENVYNNYLQQNARHIIRTSIPLLPCIFTEMNRLQQCFLNHFIAAAMAIVLVPRQFPDNVAIMYPCLLGVFRWWHNALDGTRWHKPFKQHWASHGCQDHASISPYCISRPAAQMYHLVVVHNKEDILDTCIKERRD